MAEPHPQAGHSNSPGAAGQPQVAQRQAPIGEKNLNQQSFQQQSQQFNAQAQAKQQPQPQRVVQAQPQAPARPAPVDDDPAASDWGLAPTKPGFSRENKFILFVLLVLVAVFSFVVFRNFQKKAGATPTTDVAAKDTKGTKKPDKTETDDLQTLADPAAAEDGNAPVQAATDAGANGTDPFGGEAAAEQPTTNVADGTAASQDEFVTESNTTATADETEGPPQLNATTESNELPAQATDAFETPKETPVAMVSTGSHRRGRGGHSQRATEESEIVSEPAETAQVPQEPAVIEQNTEAVGVADFTQTGGESTIQPIRQRTPSGTANSTNNNVATPPEEVVQTNPRNTNPRTAPRTATRPRGTSLPPPPLNEDDPRLGGYREGDLVQSNSTPRTAGRTPAAATVGFDPQHEPLVANVGEYIVRPNENYWKISRKVYGTPRYFAALAKHNETHVPDSKHMKPGIKISTPPKEQLERDFGDLIPAAAAPRPVGAVVNPPHAPKTPGYFVDSDGQPAYRIGSSDTLSSISHKTLGRSSRWDEIFELNRDRLAGADTLIVGAILRLPPDASQTRVVSKPVEIR